MTRHRLSSFVTRSVLVALVIGGVVFMTFLIDVDRFSRSNELCTGCHSMTYADESYRKSTHFSSSSGVRASCGDCHVSEGVFAATWDHVLGPKDLLEQFFGSDYDDPAVNLLHLPDAAFAARQWLKDRDSATCKRCHELDAIQGKRANTVAIHREETDGKSCIDCHYNLVHRHVPDQRTFKRDAWNRMVEKDLGLESGSAERILAGDQAIAGSDSPSKFSNKACLWSVL